MTPDSLSPVIRIILRYLGGFLIHAGFASDPSTFADPDLIQAICYIAAGGCFFISEGWYFLARKWGWNV